jgi:hypothetical protein
VLYTVPRTLHVTPPSNFELTHAALARICEDVPQKEKHIVSARTQLTL